MSVLEIESGSLVYVKVPIVAKVAGLVVDPTGDSAAMAFVRSGNPVSGDWKTASWETDTTTTPTTYRIKCLVGPAGTVTLTAGLYTVHAKVTDSPEIPVIKSGAVRVY